MEKRFNRKGATADAKAREDARKLLTGNELISQALVATLTDLDEPAMYMGGKVIPAVLSYDGEARIGWDSCREESSSALSGEFRILPPRIRVAGLFSIEDYEEVEGEHYEPYVEGLDQLCLVMLHLTAKQIDGDAFWGGFQELRLANEGVHKKDVYFNISIRKDIAPELFCYRVRDFWEYCAFFGLPDPSVEIVDYLRSIGELPSPEEEVASSEDGEDCIVNETSRARPANESGLSSINAQKAVAKAVARGIAKRIWKEDAEKSIRVSEMAQIVWGELVDMNEPEISKTLPDRAETLKEWIKEIAPEYARQGGRPKK